MAISNELKVSMCYSSKKAKNLCESFIADEAEVYNRSLSAMREEHILQSILPQDKKARYWFEQLYNSNAKIGDVMSNVFSYLAAGNGWKSAQKEGIKLLVEYAHTELQRMSGGIEKYEREAKMFFSCLESLKNKLEYEAEAIEDMTYKYHILETVKQLASFIDEMKDNADEFFYYKDFTLYIYITIQNFWDLLGNYTYTFRLLSCIARIQKWDNTAAGRIKLCEVLIAATENWKYSE